jgi:hypothetical protein
MGKHFRGDIRLFRTVDDTVVGFTQLLPSAVLSWRSLTAHGALPPHKNSNYNMPCSSVRVDTSMLLSLASTVMLSLLQCRLVDYHFI